MRAPLHVSGLPRVATALDPSDQAAADLVAAPTTRHSIMVTSAPKRGVRRRGFEQWMAEQSVSSSTVGSP